MSGAEPSDEQVEDLLGMLTQLGVQVGVCVVVCYSVLQCVACVAVCCSVLQCVAVRCSGNGPEPFDAHVEDLLQITTQSGVQVGVCVAMFYSL